MTVIITAIRTGKRNAIRVNLTRYDENGDRIGRNTIPANDKMTARAVVQSLYLANKSATRRHVKWEI